MRHAVVILILSLSTNMVVGQDTSTMEDKKTLFTVIRKTDTSGVVYHFEPLDTVELRIDSIFKPSLITDGYEYVSHNADGTLIGKGTFHFHTETEYYLTENETDKILLESFDWKNLHVSTFCDGVLRGNRYTVQGFYCPKNLR